MRMMLQNILMLDWKITTFAEIHMRNPRAHFVSGKEKEDGLIRVTAISQHVIHAHACLHVDNNMMQRADAQVSCRAKSAVKKMILAASATI